MKLKFGIFTMFFMFSFLLSMLFLPIVYAIHIRTNNDTYIILVTMAIFYGAGILTNLKFKEIIKKHKVYNQEKIKMRKKDLERKIEDLELEIQRRTLREDLLYTERTIDCYIDNMRIREWLIKTKFIGNLKDKKLIELLKTNPLGSEEDFKEGYHSPAFDINRKKSIFAKIGEATQKLQEALTEMDTSIYENICEEIRCQDFRNIEKFYDRIVELEKLEMFLDKYRPLKKEINSKSVARKTAVAIKQKSKKGEAKNEN